MTHPEPPPESAPESAPASDIWAAVRRDYLSGLSAAVVAERYGLSARTIQRHAALEGWRHADIRPASRIRSDWAGPAAAVMREMDVLDVAHEARPQLAQISTLADEQRHDLLFCPDASGFRLHAFHQAAEAAAVGAVNEATAWMRLLALIAQHSSVIDGNVRIYGPADHMRADYLARIDGLREAYENAPPGEPDGA